MDYKQDAFTYMKRLRELNLPEKYYSKLAGLYYLDLHPQKAIDCFNTVISSTNEFEKPELAESYYLIGKAYYKTSNYKQARYYLNLALKTDRLSLFRGDCLEILRKLREN